MYKNHQNSTFLTPGCQNMKFRNKIHEMKILPRPLRQDTTFLFSIFFLFSGHQENIVSLYPRYIAKLNLILQNWWTLFYLPLYYALRALLLMGFCKRERGERTGINIFKCDAFLRMRSNVIQI